MVEDQLEGRDIRDHAVLAAFDTVPRERFVDEEERELAYADLPLGIGYGQTISQPYMVAIICQTACVSRGDRVLDVGTGSGYQAAILAELGADVRSIERIPALAEAARANLERAGYPQVSVHVDDGSLGLVELAPYNAITVAAAAPQIPEPLVEQLAIGGRLVVPVGGHRGQRLELLVRSPEGPFVSHSVPCRFVPLVGEFGFSD